MIKELFDQLDKITDFSEPFGLIGYEKDKCHSYINLHPIQLENLLLWVIERNIDKINTDRIISQIQQLKQNNERTH